MNFGIVKEDGEICNHRSVLKVVCNPFLRLFGWQIVTWMSEAGEDPSKWKVRIGRCNPSYSLPGNLKSSWWYPMPQSRVLERRRIFF
jgi:hypothetical protein